MKYPYGKNIFLTGGSSGIGLETAKLFASHGYTVFAASRNPSAGGYGLQGDGNIRHIPLDVRDMDSIDSAVSTVLSQVDIGIVVHCAGIGIACAGEDYPPDAVSGLMETNFGGVLRVNSKLLPHLRGRGGGLCIIIGSLAGLFPIPYQSHYCASKAALDLYSATLRMELRKYGVRVSLVMPGDTNTGFTDARKYEIDESSPHYNDCLKAVQRMEKDEKTGRSPMSVAHAILKLSQRKNPPARLIVGFDYKLLSFLRRILPDRFIEMLLRKIYLGS